MRAVLLCLADAAIRVAVALLLIAIVAAMYVSYFWIILCGWEIKHCEFFSHLVFFINPQ